MQSKIRTLVENCGGGIASHVDEVLCFFQSLFKKRVFPVGDALQHQPGSELTLPPPGPCPQRAAAQVRFGSGLLRHGRGLAGGPVGRGGKNFCGWRSYQERIPGRLHVPRNCLQVEQKYFCCAIKMHKKICSHHCGGCFVSYLNLHDCYNSSVRQFENFISKKSFNFSQL